MPTKKTTGRKTTSSRRNSSCWAQTDSSKSNRPEARVANHKLQKRRNPDSKKPSLSEGPSAAGANRSKEARKKAAIHSKINRPEPVAELTYEDLERLKKRQYLDYESRMDDFVEELHQASQDQGMSPLEYSTTPKRPKLPDSDTGDKTPARPPLPSELPGSDQSTTPYDARETNQAYQARIQRASMAKPVKEVPRCRSSPDSPGVQWPLPPNVPIAALCNVYENANLLISNEKDLSRESLYDGVDEEKFTNTESLLLEQWTYHEDRSGTEVGHELMELVEIYRDVKTEKIPWEVIGAEMRSLTTESLECLYEVQLSMGLKVRPYTREEDLAILRFVVENPNEIVGYFEGMSYILAQHGPGHTHRSLMRRLLILIACHHHPQSDLMLARNNTQAAFLDSVNNMRDKHNLLIELRKTYRNKSDWMSLSERLGINKTGMETVFNKMDVSTASPAKWTREEDNRLYGAVQYLGKHWEEIAVMLRRRTADNCSKRYAKLTTKAERMKKHI